MTRWMNRWLRLKVINSALAAGCFAVAAALWLRPASPPQVLVTAAAAVPAGHDIPTPGTSAAEEALRTPLPLIDHESTTFVEALQRLSDLAHVKLEVRWSEIEAQGDRPETKVVLNVPAQTTLGGALRRLLTSVNAGHQPPHGQLNLGFQIEDGQIVVSTEADLYRYPTTIVYNIRDILDSSIKSSAGNDQRSVTITRKEALSRLAVLIIANSQVPMPAQGTLSYRPRINEIMGLLVVTLPPYQQERVAALLQALREGSRELPPASRPVEE